jgi:hypothetical protein
MTIAIEELSLRVTFWVNQFACGGLMVTAQRSNGRTSG